MICSLGRWRKNKAYDGGIYWKSLFLVAALRAIWVTHRFGAMVCLKVAGGLL